MGKLIPVFYINSRIFTPFFTKMGSKRGQKNFSMGSDLFDNTVNNCKLGAYKKTIRRLMTLCAML